MEGDKTSLLLLSFKDVACYSRAQKVNVALNLNSDTLTRITDLLFCSLLKTTVSCKKTNHSLELLKAGVKCATLCDLIKVYHQHLFDCLNLWFLVARRLPQNERKSRSRKEIANESGRSRCSAERMRNRRKSSDRRKSQ